MTAVVNPDLFLQLDAMSREEHIAMFEGWELNMPVTEEQSSAAGVREWWERISAEVVRCMLCVMAYG